MVSLAAKERMRMWKAGTCKDSGQRSGVGANLAFARQIVAITRIAPTGHRPPTTGHCQFGFTLIELLVVLSILSITISFVVPRLMGKEEAELKSASRRLLYTARRLSDEALFRKEKRVLNIDIKTGEYREGDEGKKLKLPDGVQVENISLGKEDISRGTASISFFPSGFRDEAEIKLTGRGKGYTVVIPALGERFEIRED